MRFDANKCAEVCIYYPLRILRTKTSNSYIPSTAYELGRLASETMNDAGCLGRGFGGRGSPHGISRTHANGTNLTEEFVVLLRSTR